MAIKRSKGEKTFEIFNICFMICLLLLTLYPFLYVVYASVSDPANLLRHKGVLLLPYGLHFDAYRLVFYNPIIGSSYINTIIYVTSGLVVSMALTMLGAYALAKRNVKWAPLITMIIVFTMWFSGGMIPYYLTVSGLGLLNTRLALILPRAVSTYNLIVMRTAFQQVPESLEESARMDGANDLLILIRIIIPVSMPTIAVVTLFYVSATWNAWFDAMMFINNRSLYPLQLLLREVLVLGNTNAMVVSGNVFQGDQLQVGETIKFATVIVATVPILCVYPFLQKYFVKGVMIGAVKG